MEASLRFLISQLALALLGAGAAWHPSARALSLAARAALSLCAGAVGLALEATLFSLAGIPWSIPGLALPLLLLSTLAAWRWGKRSSSGPSLIARTRGILVGSFVVCAAALLYLAIGFGSSGATSVDFLYFWGVKAVRFAGARGIDSAFLRDPFAIHATLDYPPLVPLVWAWGCLAAGRMPWRIAPLLSALWFVAALPVLFDRCRRILGDGGSAAVTAFWTAALSVSLVSSLSAGAAEPVLLFFESVAVAWLVTEDPGESRLFPALALCGAVLTKVEGLPAVVAIAVGSALRDRFHGVRRPWLRALALLAWPAAAVSLWFLYQASRGIPAGYRSHGEFLVLYGDQLGAVFKALARRIDAGSFWLPWVFAAALVLRRAAAWRIAAPAVVLSGVLLGFLAFDYLHDENDPSKRIEWTAPRVTQPALSSLILAAGVLSFSRWRPLEEPGPAA